MFPNLFAAIGTNWGNGTLDSNGNTENPENPDTGFNLPDLRGTFLRGVNGALATAPWNDPAAAARGSRYGGNTGNKVGSYQENKFKPHKHRWAEIDADASRFYRSLYSWDANGNGYEALRPFVAGGGGSSGDDDSFEVSAPANMALYTKTGTTVEETGETRPNNAYVNHIIKY